MAEVGSTQELVPSSAPQRASRLVASTFRLYGRYPLLFLVLAAAVVVPYELIALLATDTGQFSRGNAGAGASFVLSLMDLFLVSPLISALHVHAVAEVREGKEPRLATVFRRGLKVLPVVAAATIISWLGIIVGLLLFIVPGVILFLRWVVVAQAAAIGNEGWLSALHRSRQLSAGHYKHILLFFLCTSVIATVPGLAAAGVFGHHDTGTGSVLTGLAIHVVVASFSALAIALLFYDLLVRRETEVPELASSEAVIPDPVPAATPLPPDPSRDPRRYSDENRPHGWYVDPSSPARMRYWRTADPPGWEGKTRTPSKVRQLWRDP